MERSRLAESVVMVVLVGCFFVRLSATAQVCQRFEHLSMEEMTSELQRGDRSDGDCIAFLLKQLGEARYKHASYPIAAYLDFEWPKKKPDETLLPGRLRGLRGHYPAVGALYDIGTDAVPDMIRFLSGANVTPLAHKNDIATLLMIYREDQAQAVEALMKASHRVSSPEVAGRLLRAAHEAADGCSMTREACKTALLNTAE